MTVNISAQSITLTIGSQNWSAWIESIQIGYGEYEMGSGLMPCNGTINLIFPANYAGIPSNPEYRFNSSQWRRGQLVQIAVGGVALPCSGNALKILKPPQRPNRGIDGIARMAISVGCALAYNYFPPEPNDDFSGITAGNPVTFGGIIGAVLSRLGIPSNVNVGNYAIDYPLPKIEGNWLDFCGQLADSAGWYLRCDTAGIVVSELISNAGSSGVTYTIGTDESDWTAIGDVGETPIEKLIVTGVKKSLEPVSTDPNVVIEEQPLGVFVPDLINNISATALITTKRTTSSVISSSSIYKKTEVLIEEPFFNVTINFGTTYTSFLFVAERKTLEIFLSNGIITKTIETTEQPLRKISPELEDLPNSFLVIISKRITKSWEKIGDQRYRETYLEEQPFIAVAPDSSTSITLNIFSKKTTEGESAPPTDQPISDFNLREEQIKSEIYAAQLAVSEGRDRQRTISLPYAVDEAQLTAYGQIFNKILVGRAFGWRFATRLNTTLLPMRTVRVIDGTQGYILRMDAMQWAMTQTEAYIVFNGIEDGVFNVATPNDITYPVSFPIVPIAMILIPDWSVRQNLLDPAPMILQPNWTALFNEISGLFRLIPDWTVLAEAGTTLNAGLLAYWNMDEIGGDSVNRADAVGSYDFVPSTNANLEQSGFPSVINNAIYSPTMAATGISTLTDGSDVSIGFWFQANTADSGLHQVIRYPFNIALEYEVLSGDLIFYANGSDLNSPVLPDEFIYIALYFDRGLAQVNISISAAGTANLHTSSWASSGTTGLDIQLITNTEIDVYMDEMALWNRELTSDEIAELYNSGSGKPYPFT